MPGNVELSGPMYLQAGPEGIRAMAERTRALLKGCRLCPRRCGVDRLEGELGFCGVGSKPFICSHGPHFGEERPLVGSGGSGTIFMGGCNMGCIFCQNWTISHGSEGHETTEENLAGIMTGLQASGCHNINLVTPTHQVPMLLGALAIAVEGGLHLPLVYNCGGYESLETLRALAGIVDIYMPDLKYMDDETASRLSDAPGYVNAACAAIIEMHRQVGDLVTDRQGIAVRGLLVRHLVLPEGLADTGKAMRFLAREVSPDTYVNVMDQYRPCYKAGTVPALARRTSPAEYRKALEAAKRAGIRRLSGITEP